MSQQIPIISTCISLVHKGLYDSLTFNNMVEIMTSISENGEISARYKVSLKDFLNEQLPQLILTILDSEIIINEVKDAIKCIIFNSISIFNNFLSKSDIKFLDAIKLIFNRKDCLCYISIPLPFNSLIEKINLEKIEEELLNLLKEDVNECLLHKIASLSSILASAGEIKNLDFVEGALLKAEELLTSGFKETKYIYEILDTLLILKPEKKEEIQNLFNKFLEKEENQTNFISNINNEFIYTDSVYQKAVEICKKENFYEVAKILKKANKETIQAFWDKIKRMEAIDAFYPLLSENEEIFLNNFSFDDVSEENIDFILFSFEKIGNTEKLNDNIKRIYELCTKEFQFEILSDLFGDSFIDCVFKDPKHFVKHSSFDKLIEYIEKSNESKVSIDISQITEYLTKEDSKKLIAIIDKIDLNKELEKKILMLQESEEMLDLYSNIYLRTESTDLVWSSLIENGGIAVNFAVKEFGRTIIDKCIMQIDKEGPLRALTLLAKRCNCQKNKYKPGKKFLAEDDYDEPILSEEKVAQIFQNLTEKDGEKILKLLNELPTLKSEEEILSPALEFETDWLSRIEFDSRYVCLYRLNTIGNMIAHPQGKWLKVFDSTGGTETIIKAALLIAHDINEDIKNVELAFNIAREVIEQFPYVVSKIKPEEFMIAANPDSETIALFFAEAIHCNPKIINILNDFSGFYKNLVFGSENLVKAAQIILESVDIDIVQPCLISFTEEAFKDCVVSFTGLFEIAIRRSTNKKALFTCFIDNFIKRYDSTSRIFGKNQFKPPTEEFTNSLFSVLTTVFSQIEEVLMVDVLFHGLIYDILLNKRFYYKPTKQFEDLVMNLLDRFSNLIDTTRPILDDAKSQECHKFYEIDPYVPTKIEDKELTKKCTATSIAMKIFNNEDARNMIVSHIFDEETWQHELQTFFMKLMYLPSHIINTDKFVELFGEELTVNETVEKFSTLPFFSLDEFDSSRLILIEGEHTLSLTKKRSSFDVYDNERISYKKLISEIASSINYNIINNTVFDKLLKRMKDEESNSYFCIERLIQVYKESPNSISLRSISKKCCDACKTNKETAQKILDRKDHSTYILNDNKLIRNSYSEVLYAAFTVAGTKDLPNTLKELIDDDLCQKWEKVDCLFNLLAKTMHKGDQKKICKVVLKFLFKYLTGYDYDYQELDIMSKIDLSGAFIIFSSNPKVYGPNFLSIMMFNDMFKSMKHQIEFIKFMSSFLDSDKKAQNSLLAFLDAKPPITGKVCARIFILSISISDKFLEKRTHRIIDFLADKDSNYLCEFFEEIRTNVWKDFEMIYNGWFSKLDLWIHTWILSIYPKVRTNFTELLLDFINANEEKKLDAIHLTYKHLMHEIPSIIPNYMKVLKNMKQYCSGDLSVRDIFPESDFFRFFRTIIALGNLRDEFIEEEAEYLGNMICQFNKSDERINHAKIHLIFFTHKVVPPEKGPEFYRKMNYVNMINSFGFLPFAESLLKPCATIMLNTLIRTPPELIHHYFSSPAIKKAIPVIFLENLGVASELRSSIVDNLQYVDVDKFAADFLNPKLFKKNLDQNCAEYFTVCSEFIKTHPEAIESAEPCINIAWNSLQYVVVSFGKASDVYSIPTLPADKVLAQLAMFIGAYIIGYTTVFKGRKTFFGKDYVTEMKNYWHSKSLNPEHMLKVALNPRGDATDTSGYFKLIEALALIDNQYSRIVCEKFKDRNIIEEASDDQMKENISDFIYNYVESEKEKGIISKDVLCEMALNEFCHSKLLHKLCCAIASIITKEKLIIAANHIKEVLPEINDIRSFSYGLSALCQKCQLNKIDFDQEKILQKVNNIIKVEINKVCVSFADTNLVSTLKNIKNAVDLSSLISNNKLEISKTDIISLGVKVRQTENKELVKIMESIESKVLL